MHGLNGFHTFTSITVASSNELTDAFDLSRMIVWYDLHLCVVVSCMASFAVIVKFFFATEATVVNVK